MKNFWRDLQYGFRMLRNKPGFAAAAVLVLALGIGANSAVFSLINAFLLKPLHLTKPEELAGLYSRDTKRPDTYRGFSYPNYTDIRDNNSVFASLMAHNMALVGLQEGDATRRTFVDVVSSNYFSTLGVPLLRGRAFTPDEEVPGGGLSVIASYSYWNKTGQDPQLLGKQLLFNGRFYKVVGIAPQGFTGTTALVSPEFFLPLGTYGLVNNAFDGPSKSLLDRNSQDLIVVGRLRPGLTAETADARLAVIASRMAKAFPASNDGQALSVSPLSRLNISTNPSDDSALRLPAMLLLSLAGVVLIIASLNLSNMMMVRGAARKKEIAIRLAIGGGRRRIVRQLVTEGLLLALLGGVAGLFAAFWSTNLLMASLSRLAPMEFVYDARPDARVALVTLAFCGVSTIIFGLFPAWKISKPDVWIDLKDSTGEESGFKGRRLFSRTNLLVMGQLALSLLMLTAAGLFVHSAIRAANVEPGFSLENQVLAEVDASLANYQEARGRAAYTAVENRLRRMPGVKSVGFAATVPFGMVSLGKHVASTGSSHPPAVEATFNIVSQDYFRAIGIPLLRGRSFLPAEMSPAAHTHVAMIDKLAAARLFPGRDAIGGHIRVGEKDPEELEIVGVTGDVRDHFLGREMAPHLYIPFGQQYQADIQIHVAVAGGGPEADARTLDAVRRQIHEVDGQLPILALKTMRNHLESGMEFWVVRTGARILEIFGAVALFLAVVGLYAVNAYAVARRTREIGIRMALGADAGVTLRMVLGEGMKVALMGIGTGFLLAVAAGRLLAGVLYGIHGFDPGVLAAAPAALFLIALLACYVPARRAARIDPLIALRYQ